MRDKPPGREVSIFFWNVGRPMPVPFSLGPFHRQAGYGIPIGGEVLFGIRQSMIRTKKFI